MAEEKKDETKEVPKENVAKPVNTDNKPDYAWKSPDMILADRGASWTVLVILTAVLLGLILYYQQLWTGVALVAVAAIVLVVSGRIKPKEIVCAIYPEGVVVDDMVYSFAEFKSFWVAQSELPKVKLQRIGRFAGQVTMPLHSANVDTVRTMLSKHVPEEEDKGEDLVDTINRIIKF